MDTSERLGRIEEQIRNHSNNASLEARRAEEARRQDEARRAEDAERAETHRRELRKAIDGLVTKVERLDGRMNTVEKVMYGVNLSTRTVFAILASVIGAIGAVVAAWKTFFAGLWPHT